MDLREKKNDLSSFFFNLFKFEKFNYLKIENLLFWLENL
jgi:hypothetical protein